MQIEFRPITEADMPFLAQVYADSRDYEMAIIPWSDEQKAQFLHSQFMAQHAHYQRHYKEASFDVILVDGEAVGRLYLHKRADEIRIVDISLLASQRGRGIGGRILRDILQEAQTRHLSVRIHVEQNNRALNLYRRLGFKKLDENGIYYLMEWTPDA
jgi:ribosomal protein S18 acetylase RimI-like enzyme